MHGRTAHGIYMKLIDHPLDTFKISVTKLSETVSLEIHIKNDLFISGITHGYKRHIRQYSLWNDNRNRRPCIRNTLNVHMCIHFCNHFA